MGENGGASITATEVAEKRAQSTTRSFVYLVIVYLVAMTNIKKELQFDTGFFDFREDHFHVL